MNFMSDLIFRYYGPAGSPAPYGDPVVVPSAMLQYWIAALTAYSYGPEKVPFLPTYEPHTISWPNNSGGLDTAPLDQYEVPTLETASKLAQMYAVKGVPLHLVQVDFVGAGPVKSEAKTRLLQWPGPDYPMLPVKQLALYYTNNPEDKFPGVADKMCRDLIARVWKG